MAEVTLVQIHRYPVKGMAGERLAEVRLEPGRTLPNDRRFALAQSGGAGSGIDGSAWASHRMFHTLKHEEKLAQLGLSYDDASGTLTLFRAGKAVTRAKAAEPIGQSLMNQFFAAFLAGSPRGAPRLVAGRQDEAGGVAFTDDHRPTVSLINLASLADFERVARRPVDPRRFRGNLLIEGAPAWAETAWVGHRLKLGEAELEVLDLIERCAATMVNPETGQRDLNVPRLLQGGFGHMDFGLYCRVVEGGTVREGDALRVL